MPTRGELTCKSPFSGQLLCWVFFYRFSLNDSLRMPHEDDTPSLWHQCAGSCAVEMSSFVIKTALARGLVINQIRAYMGISIRFMYKKLSFTSYRQYNA
jgi:hypothetical protein